MLNKTTAATGCTANICVKRNRVKTYDSTVYLKDGQEFEIELYNPTTSTVLAKIKLDGNYISQAGLVLKPGQRVYLERYIDDSRKFLFETYTVDGSQETKDAIAQNGGLRVEFYTEYIAPPVYNQVFGNGQWGGLNSDWIGGKYPNDYKMRLSNSSAGIGGQSVNSFHSSTTLANSRGTGEVTASLTSSRQDLSDVLRSKKRSFIGDAAASTDWMEDSAFGSMDEVETGRVEKGSRSDQAFANYNGSFNTWVSSSVEWKILPLSQKPAESADLAGYCTECGTKNRKGWKFCPTCGEKY